MDSEVIVQSIIHCKNGLEATLTYLEHNSDILDSATRLLTKEQRNKLWGVWNEFLDYQLTLEFIYSRLNSALEDQGDEPEVLIFIQMYASFLLAYRYSLELIDQFERNPSIHVVLNKSVPDIGLPSKSYARLKYECLHVNRARDFLRLVFLYKKIVPSEYVSQLDDLTKENYDFLWQVSRHSGIKNTLKNGLKIVTDRLGELLYPIRQKSLFLGTIKVRRIGHKLVSNAQIQSLIPSLLPGDILLERREWHLTNLGIPGFWPHVALYVGTPNERTNYFGEDYENTLKALSNYESCLNPLEGNNLPRVIESHAPGVTFTSLEYSCGADSIAVLRPNVEKAVKARAIKRAFSYEGRPYDYDFDFRSDSALVCTELVYKSYESSDGLKGLEMPFKSILGRPVLPANNFAEVYDSEFGDESSQFEFITFLDGDEWRNCSVEKGASAFRDSWRRPKWHIVVQGTQFESLLGG
jgi:hypothetical protein